MTPPRTPTGRVGWAAAVPGALDRRVTRSFPALVLNQVQATDVRAANGSHAGCRRASAPVHAAPGAPGCPPNEELMSVSARRHPVVEARDGHTQGRNADEGFGAPPSHPCMLRSINGSTARQDGTVARQRPRIFRQISCMYTEEKSLAAAPDRVHSQLKLEEDVPQEGASLGGAPGPLRLLLRKPSSASRPCVILSRPWTSPGWRRTLTHVRSLFGGPPGAPGATWAGAGGCRHSAHAARSCASAAFCADRRAACRPLTACLPPTAPLVV